MATVYYKVHGGRLSFAEYWRMAPNPFVFCIVAVAKVFGGMPFNFSIPRVDELHLLEWNELRGEARKAMKPAIRLLEEAGMRTIFYHELPLLERDRMGCGASLLAPDGLTFATVNFVKDKVMSQMEVSCVTRFDDESEFGITTTAKKQLKPQPEHITFRYPGTPADELYEKHLEHLEDWKASKDVVKVTPDRLPKVVLRGEQGHIDFHIERGVYVPMTKAEIRAIRDTQEDDDNF